MIATHAAVEALAAIDIGECDRDGLDVARRSRQLAAEGRSSCAEDVLAQGGRRSAREARAAAAREQACAKVSGFEQALADGRVSAGHIDALAAATHRLDEAATAEFASHAEALQRQAEHETVEAFTRSCQDLARNVSHDEGESRLERQRKANRIRQWIDRVTGMYHIHAELDPESGAKAWAAINAAVRSMRHTDHSTASHPSGSSGGSDPAPDSGSGNDSRDEAPDVESWDQTAARAFLELRTVRPARSGPGPAPRLARAAPRLARPVPHLRLAGVHRVVRVL